MNGSCNYGSPRRHVWLPLALATVLSLGACADPPLPSIRAQDQHLVQLDDLRLQIRPTRGLAVQSTYFPDNDPPCWVLSWPAAGPQTRLRFTYDNEEGPLLERLDLDDEVEKEHRFAVGQSPRGRSLALDLQLRPDGGYSLSQPLGSLAPVASASLGTVETLSTVRVQARR